MLLRFADIAHISWIRGRFGAMIVIFRYSQERALENLANVQCCQFLRKLSDFRPLAPEGRARRRQSVREVGGIAATTSAMVRRHGSHGALIKE